MMKEICLEELKKIELDILIYIDQVCKKNNLRYFLCGGTLLGAVRHKGFIPWDDDIDICMPRSDYDEFIRILKNKNGKYKAITADQSDYYYNFSKIIDSETVLTEHDYRPIDNMGVYVDVFPLDGMPEDIKEQETHFSELNKLRKRINSFCKFRPTIRKNLIEYAKNIYLYTINKKSNPLKFQQQYKSLAYKYTYDDSCYVYMSGGAYGKKELFPKYFVNDYITITFEGNQFNAPKNYDLYLTQLYGDYMKFPPIEKRVTHHNFSAQHKINNKNQEKK